MSPAYCEGMTTEGNLLHDEDAGAIRASARRRRDITVAWWYTAAGVLLLAATATLIWAVFGVYSGSGLGTVAIIGVGGLVWTLALIPQLVSYSSNSLGLPAPRWAPVAASASAVAYGAVAGITQGLWLFAVAPVVVVLLLTRWGPGIRLRLVVAIAGLLGVLWFIDSPQGFAVAGVFWWATGIYTVVLLPFSVVASLWWWDMLIVLDRARASEARLGATQERLRVATDVHDLQGHHLQVIALQLQLIERLLVRDSDAALGHLHAARASVIEAQQGTRDLATGFRTVPLGSELANAVDLLRAAGMAAEADMPRDADQAPAWVLGPVIRETTTNILRYGGGRDARLTLTRTANTWRFEVENDVDPSRPSVHDSTSGSGLEGLRRRITDAGGTFELENDGRRFKVNAVVPSRKENKQ